MDRTFKISDEFCLMVIFQIMKIHIQINIKYQSCNEYKIGGILKKYPKFLVADKCEIIERIKDKENWIYKSERDNFIFYECKKTINILSDKAEVYDITHI